ncbi:MAG: hypothetical protein LAT58_07480 [Opitutales bacterium]|nr:hypothetical protein [Opitutales bacterium]
MKYYRLLTILGLCVLWMSSGLLAKTEEPKRAAGAEDRMELPEGVKAPQVVRLLRMSDEELASLRKAVEFVESMDGEEKIALRRTIGELRRSEVSRSKEAERGRTGRSEVERGPLREEWQTFRKKYEKDGKSLRDLSPAERRSLFREHLSEQKEPRSHEAARGEHQRKKDQRSKGDPRRGAKQSKQKE